MSSKMYVYRVYGLKIKSEVKLKELVILENEEIEEFDVNVSYGLVSEDIKMSINKEQLMGLSRNSTWFHIKGVATYFIKNGIEIIVEPCDNSDFNMLKTYLMCSCLGFIMLQKEKLAIHGGVIATDDNSAVILTGDRGAGKSTLATALRLKGYNLISDDVAAITFRNAPIINHGFPYQKLCEDIMDNMGFDKTMCTSFRGDNKIKYLLPVYDSFLDRNVRLSAIFELTIGDVLEVEIEELKGKEKLTKIISNIYRGEYIKSLGGMTPKYFKQCIDIAKYIKFYRITRPKEGFTLENQIKLIEREINDKVIELIG